MSTNHSVIQPDVISGQGPPTSRRGTNPLSDLTVRVGPEIDNPETHTAIDTYTRTVQHAIAAYTQLVTDAGKLTAHPKSTRCSTSRAEAFANKILDESRETILGFVKAEAKRLKETN